MSRVRFHSIKAIFEREDVDGIYTGPGWDGWNPKLTCEENILKILQGDTCDIVIAYKPLDPEIINFNEIKMKKCLRYNEMYDDNWTLKEITESKADIVICHHFNDYIRYKSKDLKRVKFKWIPHSADRSIFFPNKLISKTYDIGIMGAINITSILGNHYPLRSRMINIFGELSKNYKCKIFKHVGYEKNDSHTDIYAKEFARNINSCKIVVTDSGITKSRFGKYVEIPMCGTGLAGDVYDDHPSDIKELKKFLIEINMEMSDQQIIRELTKYITNQDLLKEKIKNGLLYSDNFKQTDYAERFIEKVCK